MRKAIVVNLLAGSGVGKSTNAARLFTMLKERGIEVELVTEYVKDMVWEGRNKIFECQPYIFGKQLYRLYRVEDKVDVIITDRPILLDIIYDPEQDEDFRKYIIKKFNQFDNINVYLSRNTPFNPNGRNQKSVEEAIEYDKKILDFLNKLKIPYIQIDGNLEGCEKVVSQLVGRLTKVKHIECGEEFLHKDITVKRTINYESGTEYIFDCPCCGKETDTLNCC